jgi:hypothetical protein
MIGTKNHHLDPPPTLTIPSDVARQTIQTVLTRCVDEPITTLSHQREEVMKKMVDLYVDIQTLITQYSLYYDELPASLTIKLLSS